MPLDASALSTTTKLTAQDIPDLAADEYIAILRVRDFPRDIAAETASMRYMPPLPLPGETEDQTASRPPELRKDTLAYWGEVFTYMVRRFHVRDKDGAWIDRDDEHPAGTARDREDALRAWGPYLIAAFQARYGSIAPNLEGRVNLVGEPLTFPGSGVLQPDGSGAAPPVAAEQGGGPAGAAAQDDAGAATRRSRA